MKTYEKLEIETDERIERLIIRAGRRVSASGGGASKLLGSESRGWDGGG